MLIANIYCLIIEILKLMEFLEKIFTTYWSQVTLILVGLGYFIKRLFDNNSKKQEINHSLFQNKKLEAVNSFFSTYAKSKQMWTHIKIYQILRNEFSPSEIDAMIFPTLNELNKNVIELQIYFDERSHKEFEDIFINMQQINNKLSELYFDYDENISDTNKSTDFSIYKRNLLEQNEYILKQITKKLKQSFQ
jgi:hypothetical protein